MARHAPQSQAYGSYQGNELHGYHQQQYGNNNGEPSYGSYDSGEGQGYAGNQNAQPPPYGSEGQAPGAAQSYYASNDEPYAQYPSEQQHQAYGSYSNQQYNRPHPPRIQSSSGALPHEQSGYQSSGQQYPPLRSVYGGSYSASGGSDVDAFKSHYEQPYVGIGPATKQPAPSGTDTDRGVMGALAGGVAGAYGGHKLGHHGIIGGIGGAVAGSIIQDRIKKEKKEKKKEKKKKDHHGRRNSSSFSSSSSSDSDSDSDSDRRRRQNVPPPNMAGNFSHSSRNIYLDGHCTLVAECCNVNGHHHRSHLDLNDCFTNENGRLLWARHGNFGASARHARLTEHGGALEAELGDGRGGWRWNKVWLNERITNEDGRLVML
ncbi:CNVH-domain-containing protein [Teratosphaeria nubilosa]|uniref:CNVH-domain-containing protein n=1 Tax=Teratosphaeria nubilosa TaxID=161662 RepID=A0A6G1LJ79_9PEZI|nr:CNVH-domain-containing protein [Teratosphaeria nubilosa]